MGRTWVAVLVLAACFTPAPKAGAPCSTIGTCPAPLICAADNTCQTTGGDVDAPPTSDVDALVCGPDEAPCVAGCGADACLRPAHVTGFGGLLGGVAAKTLATAVLNTSTGAIGAARAANVNPATYEVIAGIGFVRRAQANNAPAIAIWVFGDLTVTGTLTASGDASVLLASASSVTVTGVIDVSANLLQPGPGGLAGGTFRTAGGGCGGGGAPAGTGTSGDTGQTEGGGGGGGFGTNGGAGGVGGGTAGTGGAAGACNITLDTILVGGSGGGGGDTSGTVPGPFGGGGGGALQLTAMGNLVVTGTLAAGGGGGRTAEGNGRDGAGGGAGGTIFLEAPAITLAPTAAIFANGGGGGSASSGTGVPCVGPLAENGKRNLVVANGSRCAQGNGGDGAASTTAATAGGSGGGGGGGGGGLGRIVLRTLPGTTPMVAGTLSPGAASPAFAIKNTLE